MKTTVPEQPRTLIVDDDPYVGEYVKDVLTAAGLTPVWHFDPIQGLAAAQQGLYDVILLDVMMPGMDGLTFLRKLKEVDSKIEVIMLTARGEANIVERAIRLGAFEYLVKPTSIQKILATIRAAMTRRVQSEGETPKPVPVGSIERGFLAAGQHSADLLTTARRISAYSSTVLITGPEGTGKRHLARVIHQLSGRPQSKMVEVDLAGLPKAGIENAILAGLGPWTGPSGGEVGALKRADGGTLILAHVELLPLPVQELLLTLIDVGQLLEPPYEDDDYLDVHLVATSSVDLGERVHTGRLLEDLRMRLQVVEFKTSPLASRIEEVLPLATYILKAEAIGSGKFITGMGAGVERLLLSYPWPGNVAELVDVIALAVRGVSGGTLTVADLPASVRDHGKEQGYHAAEAFLKS